MLRIIVTTILFFGLASTSKAQDNTSPAIEKGEAALTQSTETDRSTTHYLAIELDPAPFIFGGYSVSAKYSPKGAEHFTLMGSVYRSSLPDALMSAANKDNGFKDVKLETSYAVFVDYFIAEDRTGFHFGPSVFLYSKTVGKNETSDRASFKSIYPNVRVGYLYQPFEGIGLYVNPWVNIGKEIFLGENNRVGTTEFVPNDISYIAAIHIGYQVDL